MHCYSGVGSLDLGLCSLLHEVINNFVSIEEVDKNLTDGGGSVE